MEMWLSVVFEIQRPIKNKLFINGILIFRLIKKPLPQGLKVSVSSAGGHLFHIRCLTKTSNSIMIGI